MVFSFRLRPPQDNLRTTFPHQHTRYTENNRTTTFKKPTISMTLDNLQPPQKRRLLALKTQQSLELYHNIITMQKCTIDHCRICRPSSGLNQQLDNTLLPTKYIPASRHSEKQPATKWANSTTANKQANCQSNTPMCNMNTANNRQNVENSFCHQMGITNLVPKQATVRNNHYHCQCQQIQATVQRIKQSLPPNGHQNLVPTITTTVIANKQAIVKITTITATANKQANCKLPPNGHYAQLLPTTGKN